MIDLARVMTSLTEEIAFGDGDPSAVIDRYYTPDIVQYVDGRFRRQHMLTRSVTGREEAPTTREPAGSTGERVT